MSSSEPKSFDLFRDDESGPDRHHPREFDLEEFAPGKRSSEAEKAEQGGFRLLVYGGRQEDPLERAERQAAELMADARSGVDAARSEADGIRSQAYEEGYAQGQEEGREAGRARVEAALMDLTRTLTALDQGRVQAMEGLEDELVALVQAVAERVLMAPGVVPRDLVRDLTAKAISRLTSAETVTVRLAPADIALVEEFRPQLLKEVRGLKRLHLVEEEGMSPGDCVVESPSARVDATLATRRKRIFDLLGDTLHQGPEINWQALETEDEAAARPEDAEAGEAAAEESPSEPEPDSGREDW